MTDQVRTARVAGAWYLGLAVTGVLGFLLVRPAIYVDADAAATLANLQDQGGLARLGVVLEMGIVVTQALAAIWFYKLFRGVSNVAAVSIAAFGLVNAVAIMASAAFLATAVAVAEDTSLAPAGDAAATVGLLYELSSNAWGVGALFFGLWLIPMGWVAITTARYPRALGWILVVGGVGYMLSSVVDHAFADRSSLLVEGLTLPASVGEFWMIGYLLIRGIRPEATAPADRRQESSATDR
ncbi:DUF4386 domain-containing protein [Nocardioides donggukensis]|uniref:DUF4386 domain-containing protein n=1 Tax=Nocardioides donggukensis TaxID=2774019 RepID=A0A927K3A6_9ACTN|nr:DUF4386 domain-containing protein [Nocardioides donggukensis]MBD8869314.1 DUF4386 domain-containing protein [Nocardioides donggukensis]